jgi:hypothetical protein
MKLVKRGVRNYTLEGLKTDDFKWKNAEGRPGLNPNYAPQHYIMVWVSSDVADQMVEEGFEVRMAEDKKHLEDGVKPYVKFIIKPKMRENQDTGEEEFVPKVVMKTPSSTTRFQTKSKLVLIDRSLIEKADMAFHSWAANENRPPSLYIDSFWFTTADSVGTGGDEFDAEYGYASDNVPEPDEEDEVAPF